jgi:hypothetical protein
MECMAYSSSCRWYTSTSYSLREEQGVKLISSNSYDHAVNGSASDPLEALGRHVQGGLVSPCAAKSNMLCHGSAAP